MKISKHIDSTTSLCNYSHCDFFLLIGRFLTTARDLVLASYPFTVHLWQMPASTFLNTPPFQSQVHCSCNYNINRKCVKRIKEHNYKINHLKKYKHSLSNKITSTHSTVLMMTTHNTEHQVDPNPTLQIIKNSFLRKNKPGPL